MRTRWIGLIGACIAIVLPATALGQASDLDEAVGLGGRVVVAEAGYALTLPDDWVHIRPSDSDVGSITAEVYRTVPDLGPTIEAALGGGLSFSLLAFDSELDATFSENCNMLDRPSGGAAIEAIGADELSKLAALGDLLAGEPALTFVELSFGRVGRLDLGLQLPEFDTASTSYLLTDGTWVHTLTCTDLVRPDDAWLRIVERFEFLAPVP